MISAYKDFIKSSFDFTGRTNNIKFCYTLLVHSIILLALTWTLPVSANELPTFHYLSKLYTWFTVLPLLSMFIRRIRDWLMTN